MMRILFVASEGLPFSKTGGLADVIEALPKALVAQGHEVAVVLPRYRGTKADTPIIPSLTIPLGSRLRFPAIADGKAINLRELNARVPKEVLGSIRGVIDVLQEVKEALGVS